MTPAGTSPVSDTDASVQISPVCPLPATGNTRSPEAIFGALPVMAPPEKVSVPLLIDSELAMSRVPSDWTNASSAWVMLTAALTSSVPLFVRVPCTERLRSTTNVPSLSSVPVSQRLVE